MSKTTISQEIIAFIRNQGGEATRSAIVNECAWRYYSNHQHYIGEALNRLVRSGVLKRTKRGVYSSGNIGIQTEIKF